MPNTVTDRDLGWSALLRQLQQLRAAPTLYVGLPADQVDADLIVAASANEFGTPTIPARPAFRSTVDERQSQIADQLAEALALVVDGQLTVDVALSRVGEVTAGWIKETIRTLRDPPNAASTIAAKGSDNPLIDTGRTRAAVTYTLRTGG